MPIPDRSPIRGALEDALGELHTISVRAELQDSYYPIHIPIGTFIKFDSPDWEIVFGSPGSGKTILLRAWQEAVFDAPEPERILPAYVSGRDLGEAPGQAGDPAALAEAHFQAFLEQFGAEVRDASQRTRQKETFRDRRDGKRQAKAVDDLLEAINRAVKVGREVQRPGQMEYVEEDTTVTDDQTLMGAGIRGRVSAFFRLFVSGRIERSKSKDATVRRQRRRSGTMSPHFAEVNRRIEDLAQALGVERFCVLFDEWSAIDAAVQPRLAAWLLRAFHGTRRISIKIASNRGHTRIWDEKEKLGFELGENLFDAGALDHPQMTEADLIAFFEEMLFKRLVSLRSDLGPAFVRDRLGRPGPEFLAEMFATPQAFELLATGTEGIPRTFLASFQKLIDQGLPERGWTVDEVQELVGQPEQPLQVLEVFKDDFSEGEVVFQWVIRPVAVSTESRFFLVRAADRERAEDPLGELLRLKLIECADAEILPAVLREEFDPYRIGDALWGTLGRPILYKRGQEASQGPTEGLLYPKEPRIFTAEDALPYVLDFSRWRA